MNVYIFYIVLPGTFRCHNSQNCYRQPTETQLYQGIWCNFYEILLVMQGGHLNETLLNQTNYEGYQSFCSDVNILWLSRNRYSR